MHPKVAKVQHFLLSHLQLPLHIYLPLIAPVTIALKERRVIFLVSPPQRDTVDVAVKLGIWLAVRCLKTINVIIAIFIWLIPRYWAMMTPVLPVTFLVLPLFWFKLSHLHSLISFFEFPFTLLPPFSQEVFSAPSSLFLY